MKLGTHRWVLRGDEADIRCDRYSLGTISWWMLDLWFGLDASGFERASESALPAPQTTTDNNEFLAGIRRIPSYLRTDIDGNLYMSEQHVASYWYVLNLIYQGLLLTPPVLVMVSVRMQHFDDMVNLRIQTD